MTEKIQKKRKTRRLTKTIKAGGPNLTLDVLGESGTSASANKRRKYTQAERVVMHFGGAAELRRLIKHHLGKTYNLSTIYRWMGGSTQRNEGKAQGFVVGSGGVIPSKAWGDILKMARMEGIILTQEDYDPRPL